MNQDWPRTPLGEVLTQAGDRYSVSAGQEYPNFGIFSFGRGLFAKQAIDGSTSSATSLYRAKAGQFVYSRLFAFEGAYGIITDEYDGLFVSNEFPLFDCDNQRIHPGYLGWYFRNPRAWKEVAQLTTGMGDRRQRVKPENFLTYSIPLPPLAEQCRIVATIDQLAARIDEAIRLSERNDERTIRLLGAMAHRHDLGEESKAASGWQKVRLTDVLTLSRHPEPVAPERVYPNVGIYSYARGVFPKPHISGLTTSATRLYRINSGQFIYSRLFAFEGAYAMVTQEFDGMYVSNEFPTFDCAPDRLCAEFLWAYFRAPAVWSQMAEASVGLGDRRQRIKPEHILAHSLWLPPIEWQRRIAHTQQMLSEAVSRRVQVSTALDALLPSILDRAFKGEL